jgi:hypothetical protein
VAGATVVADPEIFFRKKGKQGILNEKNWKFLFK